MSAQKLEGRALVEFRAAVKAHLVALEALGLACLGASNLLRGAAERGGLDDETMRSIVDVHARAGAVLHAQPRLCRHAGAGAEKVLDIQVGGVSLVMEFEDAEERAAFVAACDRSADFLPRWFK